MPRNSRQPARPHSSSFSFLAISLPIPFHPFFFEIKKLPSLRDESLRFVFPPNFIRPSPDIPLKVLSNPDPVSGVPGRTYYHFSPSNSEMHFSFLSISALTIRTRFAVFRRLLFSSSFRCVYFTTIRNACQQDFCKIFVYLKIQWPASILSICFSSTS